MSVVNLGSIIKIAKNLPRKVNFQRKIFLFFTTIGQRIWRNFSTWSIIKEKRKTRGDNGETKGNLRNSIPPLDYCRLSDKYYNLRLSTPLECYFIRGAEARVRVARERERAKFFLEGPFLRVTGQGVLKISLKGFVGVTTVNEGSPRRRDTEPSSRARTIVDRRKDKRQKGRLNPCLIYLISLFYLLEIVPPRSDPAIRYESICRVEYSSRKELARWSKNKENLLLRESPTLCVCILFRNSFHVYLLNFIYFYTSFSIFFHV